MKDVISMNLKGKTIVLGITGGIAAYKMPNVAHALVKLGADVHVLMTGPVEFEFEGRFDPALFKAPLPHPSPACGGG